MWFIRITLENLMNLTRLIRTKRKPEKNDLSNSYLTKFRFTRDKERLRQNRSNWIDPFRSTAGSAYTIFKNKLIYHKKFLFLNLSNVWKNQFISEEITGLVVILRILYFTIYAFFSSRTTCMRDSLRYSRSAKWLAVRPWTVLRTPHTTTV